MIKDKNSLIEAAERKLKYAKQITEQNEELFDECIEYHNIWEDGKEGRVANLSMTDNYVGVNLQIYLTKDDSIEDVNFFLDEIPYEVIETDEYTEGEWIRYTFETYPGQLTIFCHYDNSEHCKLVETGETKPVYKRVCA